MYLNKMDIVCIVCYLCCILSTATALFIDGCPMYGCRPSGSFSFYLQVPKPNASLNWVSNLQMDPIPNPLGCVSDSSNIVCQSNGVFPDEQGYISLQHNGSIAWRDKLLHFPPLPIIDNYGDVTGSDGDKLVHYDQNGKTYPAIPCHNLKPIFSMALVGDSDLLLVSGNGNIVVRETNGIPVGSLTLNATVKGTNGTFVPIAQPAINSNENRFYLLTSFVAQNSYIDDDFSGVRVYAIDVHKSISNRVTIAWSVSVDKYFGRQQERSFSRRRTFKDTMQSVLFDRVNKIVFVSAGRNTGSGSVLGIDDSGHIMFARNDTNVQSMTKFVTDHCFKSKSSKISIAHACDVHTTPASSLLWILTNDQAIEGVDTTGKTQRKYSLSQMLNASVEVTSQLSSVRNSDEDNDTLVFAAVLTKQTSTNININFASSRSSSSLHYRSNEGTQTSYVIAIDTSKDAVMWMVPVPNNMRVRGQISGAGGADVGAKDQFIAYAENTNKTAVFFSIQ